MRAVVVQELSGPDGAVLAEVAEPEGSHWLSPGERLLIEVHAAAICFPDLLQSRGRYQHSVPAPFISGGEVAGVVLEAPPGSPLAPGDRVCGVVRRGAMAERALAPPAFLLRLPDHMSYAEGAALYINYTTAWFGLHRAGAREGETVLIQGAAGGVGTAAIEVAKVFGARTISLVSSDAKAAAVRALGTDHVVRSTGPWLEEVRELTDGRGVEVVLDMVGGDRFLDSVRALAIGGRLVVIGFAGGEIPTVKVNRLLLRNLTLTGISVDIFEDEHPGTMARVNAAVQALADAGALHPLIGARVPLEDGAEALRIMERRDAIGKIVVDVRAPSRVERDELERALRRAGAATGDGGLAAADAAPIGIGAMADTFQVRLRWSPGATGPASLVVKLPSTDPQAARTAASLGAYEREARFYAELAPRTALSVPAYYGTLPGGGLLLEDLAHLQPGDQFTDMAPERLRQARRQLVALQAPFWDDPGTAALDWLHRRQGVPIPGIVERMERSWATAAERLTGDFDAAERAVIDRFVGAAGAWAESLARPFTLSHHDFRADNLLMGGERLVVLDWQTVGWGAPMFDVAYLLCTSVGPDTRRSIERDEVRRHVDELGVEWSHAAAWDAYRQASWATLLMLVPPTGSVKASARLDRMFRRLLRHGARMALDLRAEEFLT